MWPSKGTLKCGHIRQLVTIYMFIKYESHCEWYLKLKSHNTSYCLIEVVTKAGLIVYVKQYLHIWFNQGYSRTSLKLFSRTKFLRNILELPRVFGDSIAPFFIKTTKNCIVSLSWMIWVNYLFRSCYIKQKGVYPVTEYLWELL